MSARFCNRPGQTGSHCGEPPQRVDERLRTSRDLSRSTMGRPGVATARSIRRRGRTRRRDTLRKLDSKVSCDRRPEDFPDRVGLEAPHSGQTHGILLLEAGVIFLTTCSPEIGRPVSRYAGLSRVALDGPAHMPKPTSFDSDSPHSVVLTRHQLRMRYLGASPAARAVSVSPGHKRFYRRGVYGPYDRGAIP